MDMKDTAMGHKGRDGSYVGSTLRGLTLRKIIIIIIVILTLKATWNFLSNMLYGPTVLDLADSEFPDEFGRWDFHPSSCEMKDGKCVPYSDANIPIPSKGLIAYGDNFFLDGRKFKIFSGSFHYFRTHPVLWGDRLLRMKAAGLNTVMTYIPWNFHETHKGDFNLGGIFDLTNFIQQVQKVGLYLIIRPGPYICAEWEFGGLPAWLLRDPHMLVRNSLYKYEAYMTAVTQYFSELFPVLAKYTYKRGGPIIAFQVENEFGSFGRDIKYLKLLVEQYQKWQMDELLFTSDGDEYLVNGTLPDILATVNLGDSAAQRLGALKAFQPNRPLMVTEYWAGWFDHWGEKHHTVSNDKVYKNLDIILSMNSSVNIYMFVGGTNFGFWNGANYIGSNKNRGLSMLGATVTSYDYDAPVSECGDISPKYHMIRELLSKYSPYPVDLPSIPPNPPKKAYGKAVMTEFMNFEDIIELVPEKGIHFRDAEYMERLPINNDGGQAYGWLLYRSKFKRTPSVTIEGKITDRGQVFVNGRLMGVFSYWDDAKKSQTYNLNFANDTLKAEDNVIDLFVENMGRINYERVDYHMVLLNKQRKGADAVFWVDNSTKILGWDHIPFEFCQRFRDSLKSSQKWAALDISVVLAPTPTLFRGSLNIEDEVPQDTFIHMQNWQKGIVLINGFNLGRFWSRGPQQTLYVPSPILKSGANDVIIFETSFPPAEFSIDFRASPVLG